MEEGVPGCIPVSCVVGKRIQSDILEVDLRGHAGDDSPEDVIISPALALDVEPEPVAIERESRGDVPHDEARHDAGNVCCSHMSYRLSQTDDDRRHVD